MNFQSISIFHFLEAYIKALGSNEYYEQVLKVIANFTQSNLQVKRLYDENWYEIDDIQDLNIAESIFASPEDKLDKFTHDMADTGDILA